MRRYKLVFINLPTFSSNFWLPFNYFWFADHFWSNCLSLCYHWCSHQLIMDLAYCYYLRTNILDCSKCRFYSCWTTEQWVKSSVDFSSFSKRLPFQWNGSSSVLFNILHIPAHVKCKDILCIGIWLALFSIDQQFETCLVSQVNHKFKEKKFPTRDLSNLMRIKEMN